MQGYGQSVFLHNDTMMISVNVFVLKWLLHRTDGRKNYFATCKAVAFMPLERFQQCVSESVYQIAHVKRNLSGNLRSVTNNTRCSDGRRYIRTNQCVDVVGDPDALRNIRLAVVTQRTDQCFVGNPKSSSLTYRPEIHSSRSQRRLAHRIRSPGQWPLKPVRSPAAHGQRAVLPCLQRSSQRLAASLESMPELQL